MKKCNYKEGYLLIYLESDEIHVDLISGSHYKRIVSKLDAEGIEEEAFRTEPLYSWFSQTMCNKSWPYFNTKINGTVHTWRT